MKKYVFISLAVLVSCFSSVLAQSELNDYLEGFSYEDRKEMKVSSEQIVQLLIDEKAVLVDIRFEEEQAAWQMDYAIKMPLPSLPSRFSELPKDKLIVTACPHKDRAIIAMIYLKEQGFNVAYLKDGLIGLAEHLRGDNAKDFIDNLVKE